MTRTEPTRLAMASPPRHRGSRKAVQAVTGVAFDHVNRSHNADGRSWVEDMNRRTLRAEAGATRAPEESPTEPTPSGMDARPSSRGFSRVAQAIRGVGGKAVKISKL